MLSRLISVLRRRAVRIALSVALSAALGALLVLTIHYTRFDLQWLAFLGGVLFAAVLALVSQASKAEWLLLRRSRQVDRLKEQLAEETARARNALQGMQAAEARIRMLGEQLPLPLLYFNRDGLCRHYNRTCTEWLGAPAASLENKSLHDMFGSTLASRIEAVLGGQIVERELHWRHPHDGLKTFRAKLLPCSPDGANVTGFYLVLARDAAPAPPPRPEPEPDAGETASEEALYLDSIADELMATPDPREKLEQAMRENQFLLFAQKLLPLRSGTPEPECYEILLRLQEEEDHLLPPGGFIPVAERYGMLAKIDCWVTERLIAWCLENTGWFAASRIPMFCVNLSASTLRDGDFPDFVQGLLARYGFPPRALCFEVSQPDVLAFNDATRRLFGALRSAGCRVGIDDFGSAKVSFLPLHGMAIDFLKIDGSIIQGIARDASELAKARAIHAVCRKTGIRSIAEFVETGETLSALRGIGVDYVQGFGIARPAPIEQVFRRQPGEK